MSALPIRVTDLTKTYPGGTRALRGVTFDARDAEVLSLLGRNGGGKTTSVRIMTGLTHPTGGRVEVLGADVVTERRWVQQRIGVTLQAAALDEVLTGRELLVLVGRFWGLGRAESRRRAEELLQLFGLTASAGRQVRTYSGGMQRRLDIAASLVRLPQVLFLDEPTTGLDPQNRRALWQEIRRLREQHGITVLLTTQYLEEAEALADRIAVLDQGRLVATGTPDGLRRTHGATRLQVRVPDGDLDLARTLLDPAAGPGQGGRLAIAGNTLLAEAADGLDAVAAVQRLAAHGVEVVDVEVHRDSLEDVFLALTGHDAAPGTPTGAPGPSGRGEVGTRAGRATADQGAAS